MIFAYWKTSETEVVAKHENDLLNTPLEGVLARKDNTQSYCSVVTICKKVQTKTRLIVPEFLLSGFSLLVSDLRACENPKAAHSSIPDGPYPHKAITVVNVNRGKE